MCGLVARVSVPSSAIWTFTLAQLRAQWCAAHAVSEHGFFFPAHQRSTTVSVTNPRSPSLTAAIHRVWPARARPAAGAAARTLAASATAQASECASASFRMRLSPLCEYCCSWWCARVGKAAALCEYKLFVSKHSIMMRMLRNRASVAGPALCRLRGAGRVPVRRVVRVRLGQVPFGSAKRYL